MLCFWDISPPTRTTQVQAAAQCRLCALFPQRCSLRALSYAERKTFYHDCLRCASNNGVFSDAYRYFRACFFFRLRNTGRQEHCRDHSCKYSYKSRCKLHIYLYGVLCRSRESRAVSDSRRSGDIRRVRRMAYLQKLHGHKKAVQAVAVCKLLFLFPGTCRKHHKIKRQRRAYARKVLYGIARIRRNNL